jgi:hypothetical protein
MPRAFKKKDFFSSRGVNNTLWQDCQICLRKTYQNGEKCTKWLQNKIYKMFVKYTKQPKTYKHFLLVRPSKIYIPNGSFGMQIYHLATLHSSRHMYVLQRLCCSCKCGSSSVTNTILINKPLLHTLHTHKRYILFWGVPGGEEFLCF